MAGREQIWAVMVRRRGAMQKTWRLMAVASAKVNADWAASVVIEYGLECRLWRIGQVVAKSLFWRLARGVSETWIVKHVEKAKGVSRGKTKKI